MKIKFSWAIIFLTTVLVSFNFSFIENEISAIETSTCIQPGEIVINEIMQDPKAVSDSNGEWFEVFNATNSDLDLQGCTISDAGSNSHLINASLPVPANDYVVLAKNDDLSVNGGVDADYKYSGFALSNNDDEIIINCCEMEIDRVEYDGGADWPDPVGASMVLASLGLDNNIGGNWCTASSIYGGGDLGTPGSLNDSCNGGQQPVCGNGSVEPGEECDDNNNQDGDGCSAECMFELACDDGIHNGDEQGIDCGGSCPNQDCCSNGYWDENLGEQGVDCGGQCGNTDNDNDGYADIACGGTDFDDGDPTCYPGAPEICDTKDNDNDGMVDEGFSDFDNDGMADCVDTDDDNDGATDENDLCPNTHLPESLPYRRLIFRHYAEVDGDGIFETRRRPFRPVADSQYSLQDTYGCSCEQVLDFKPGRNWGEKMFGCRKDTIRKFINQKGWAQDLVE